MSIYHLTILLTLQQTGFFSHSKKKNDNIVNRLKKDTPKEFISIERNHYKFVNWTFKKTLLTYRTVLQSHASSSFSGPSQIGVYFPMCLGSGRRHCRTRLSTHFFHGFSSLSFHSHSDVSEVLTQTPLTEISTRHEIQSFIKVNKIKDNNLMIEMTPVQILHRKNGFNKEA
jgi:hypothetical protein